MKLSNHKSMKSKCKEFVMEFSLKNSQLVNKITRKVYDIEDCLLIGYKYLNNINNPNKYYFY